MNRTCFIVDGFNVYHSAKRAAEKLGPRQTGTKWLNLNSLCSSYLHLVGNGAQLSGIYYFSALATHLEPTKPDVTARHRTYINALKGTGVVVQLGRFKPKQIRCHSCSTDIQRHEEKETDVAIAVKLIELLVTDAADTVILMTGDTDLAPAVRLAKQLYPAKTVGFAFPFERKNRELEQLVKLSFTITKEAYARHQLPSPITLPNGTTIEKPSTW